MKTHYIKTAFITVFILTCFAMPSWARPPRAKLTIKVATIAPKGHAMTKRMDLFDAEVREKTGNAVGFKVYWGGVQGDDAKVLRKIRIGQLNGGFFTGSGLGRIVPDVRVTEIPYVFKTDDEISYVRKHLEPDLKAKFKEKGFVIMGGFTDVGFVYNFSKVPILSLDTLRQQKCWVPSDDALGQAIYEAMGIKPVPLSVNDVMTSVSTNLVDTGGMTPFGAVAFRWYTRFKYMSDFPIMNVMGANIVTKKVWNKISPEHQQIINALALKYQAMQQDDLHKANADSIGVLKEAGINIVHVDPDKAKDELDFLLEAGVRARESQVGKLYSQELLDKALKLAATYRDKNAMPDAISFIK